jgi:hypothetical protein
VWRTSWSERIERLDPERDHLEVHQLVCAHEFPWDTLQALSFALFRTYAVPSIGGLLDRTGELTGRTQKRYEDTGLLLDTVLEHGTGSEPGRQALRRVNAMHAAYDIRDDDLRYVLSTFVVMPLRWNAEYGWRPFTELEKRASVAYHRSSGGGWASATCPARGRTGSGCSTTTRPAASRPTRVVGGSPTRPSSCSRPSRCTRLLPRSLVRAADGSPHGRPACWRGWATRRRRPCSAAAGARRAQGAGPGRAGGCRAAARPLYFRSQPVVPAYPRGRRGQPARHLPPRLPRLRPGPPADEARAPVPGRDHGAPAHRVCGAEAH